MKRFFLLLVFITIVILMFGCRRKENDNTVEIKKIENTTEIVMNYGVNSYIPVIIDQEEIKQLEDLFNGAKFTKSDTRMQQPFLRIIFSGEIPVAFNIDHNDVIDLGDEKSTISENCVKSKQINFEYLYSIFEEHIK